MPPMRIGVYGSRVAGLDEMADDVNRAEEEGFASYWLPQWTSVDALTAFAVASQSSTRIELGTSVVPIHGRHPLVLAMQVMTTQAATRGRLQLGIGLSHRPVVEDQMGLSYERPARHMSEYLEALDSLLRTGEANVKGELLQCEASISPFKESPPPVLLAALGPHMLALAGRAAAGTVLWLTGPKTVREHVAPRIREAAERANRPAPRIVAGLPICVTDDPERARHGAKKIYASIGLFSSYKAVLAREGASGPEDVALIGDESDVAASLAEMHDAGVTEFVGMDLSRSEGEAERTRALLRTFAARAAESN